MRKRQGSVWRRFGLKARVNLNALTALLEMCPPENLVEDIKGILAVALMVFLLLGGGIAQEKGAGSVTGTKIVVLGTGTPLADPDRSWPPLHVLLTDTPS